MGSRFLKLTLFSLVDDEIPEVPYGERATDYYQDTEGIKRSGRKIPADIPKAKIVSSSFDQLDPKKQLREAGYPFDHIGTELTTLHGKFEVVSKDVLLLKDQFEQRTKELSGKIENETRTLSEKFEDSRKNILAKVETLFDRKFLRIAGIVVGAFPIMYGGITFLQGTGLGGNVISFITMTVGILIIVLTCILSRRG